MKRLVPAEPETLEMQRRQHVIGTRQPLWHAVVVRVLRPERELLPGVSHFLDERRPPAKAPVCRDAAERRIALQNHAPRDVVAGARGFRRLKYGLDELVIEEW